LGFTDCVDYKAANFREALHEVCAPGIDIYFDNVGGPILDAALANINFGSRIVCCGSVSRYDAETPPAASLLVPSVLTIKRSLMEGFIVLDYGPRRAEAERRLAQWVTRKELRVVTDIIEGFEHVPEALVRLLAGGTRGKAAVRIGDMQSLSTTSV
jgi:NADPH-dependent curcumin reductase CurA